MVSELHRAELNSSKVEHLPICDLIFIVASLLLHAVQQIALVLAIFHMYTDHPNLIYFVILLTLFIVGCLAVNGLSLYWYLNQNESQAFNSVDIGLHVCLHVFQLSLIWRYVILLRRIRLDVVKMLICELCLLRFLHSAFISAFSMLTLTYLSFTWWYAAPRILTAAAILCFVDFCWALASIGRKTRRDRADRLVLCWPGILTQFLSCLGFVGSRTVAIIIYASYFAYYAFMVVILHWILMVIGLLLVFPTFKGIAIRKRVIKSLAWGLFYVLAFFNFSKKRTKARFVAYYATVFAENTLLACIWLGSSLSVEHVWTSLHTFVCVWTWGGFAFGVLWLLVYYRFAHANILRAKFENCSARTSRTSTRTSSHQPAVFACSAQIPFKKQPSRFRPPVPIAPSASASSAVTQQTTTTVELAERRSKSAPSVNRKERRNVFDELATGGGETLNETRSEHTSHSNTTNRVHDTNGKFASLSSANANSFRTQNETSDSSDELTQTLSNCGQKRNSRRKQRPTSVGSIILRNIDDERRRDRIETVF